MYIQTFNFKAYVTHFLMALFLFITFMGSAIARDKVFLFHERVNGPSTFNQQDNGKFYDAELAINGKVVGANRGFYTMLDRDCDGDGQGDGNPIPAIKFEHDAGKLGKLELTVPLFDCDGLPTVVRREAVIDNSVLGAFPEVAQYNNGTNVLALLATNINKDNPAIVWKATGIFRKVSNIEVRCVFIFDGLAPTRPNILAAIGCEFYFYGDPSSKDESEDSSA